MSDCDGELVAALNAVDVHAEEVWVRGHRIDPTEATARALLADRHMIVRLPGDVFVDVTRRQYNPQGIHPRYYSSEADLACDWREIDDGPPSGRIDEAAWRALELAPWTPGDAGQGPAPTKRNSSSLGRRH